MRIVSDFRDYYDCIQAYGQDDLLYVRRKSVVEYRARNSYPLPEFRGGLGWNWRLLTSALTIGFAGKVYYGLVFGERRVACLSPDDVQREIDKRPKRDRVSYSQRPGRKPSRWSPSSEEIVRGFFNPEREPRCVPELFEKAPIWVGRQDGGGLCPSITFDACLRPLQFMRVLEPYAAFQELFMYLSNQARPLKPIPTVSDADMVIAKGFDKHSFRKQPAGF